jgi:geranylgeranyl diphosphate synthase type II
MLADYLRVRKALVDEALESGLPREDVPPEQVHAAMRHATLSNGKRLRPILSLAVAELAGYDPKRMLGPACAIELVHTASLILDDLPCMDDAETRRGRPCTHLQYGEATALLAVMGLLSLAFDFAASDAGAVRILAEAMGTQGLVLGQHIDLEQTGHACASLEVLEEVHRCKAGALFLACVQIPAHIAGMSAAESASLETYARNVGFAFQITDDLLDARRGSEDLGKGTLLTLLGRDAAVRKAHALVRDAIEALRIFGDNAEPLRALAAYVTARSE